MKTEINNENKAKFFAQYWGQKVAGNNVVSGLSAYDYDEIKHCGFPSHLTLTNISNITDDDSMAFREIMHWPTKEIKSVAQTIVLLNMNMFPMVITDYLRSKGYALPWMGLSVDEMVQAGWIKLK